MMTVAVGRPLERLIRLAYRANLPVLLIGGHGIGKSEVLADTARALGLDCLVLDLSLCEPVDLVGLPRVEAGATTFAPPAILPKDGAGLLVLEELNRAPRHTLAPCLQLLTARKLNSYLLPQGWLPVASINAPTDDADGAEYHVDELDPALTSRFLQVRVAPDVEEWLAWARNHDIHESVVEAVEAGRVEAFTASGANPRAWRNASDLLKAYDVDHDGEEALLAGLVGVLGDRWGTIALRTFVSSQKPLKAAEIVSAFPRWRPLVEAWRRSHRLDLLNESWAALQRHLSSNRVARAVSTDADRRANVLEFIGMLPADIQADARAWLEAQLAAFRRKASTSRAG